LIGFVAAVDNTIIAAAAPSIGRELGLTVTQLQVVALGYMVPFAALLLLTGPLIDRWGQRAALTVGLLGFGFGAVLGGLSRSAEPLIVARVLQGSAAALLVPGTLSLLRTALDECRRTTGTAVWTVAVALALALGPSAGGLLSQYLHWSWIFYANLPFVLLTLALLPLVRCTGPRPGVPLGRFPTALLREPVFAGGLLVQVLWGLGISGVVFFTPLVHQDWLGLSPTASSLPLMLVALALAAGVPLVNPALRRFGIRPTVCAGLLTVAAGLAEVAAVNHLPELAPRIPGLVLVGLGSAFTVPLTAWSLDQLAERDAGVGSGLLTASRELATALGIALVGGVLAALRSAQLAAGAEPAAALATGYTGGLVAAAVLELAAAYVVVRIRPARPAPITPTLVHNTAWGAQ
jgi:MFS family permease